MRGILAACVAVFVLAGCASDVETGRAAYVDLCADCHGAAGRGDGVLADSLRPRPADLTRISARNGGIFPIAAVISKIDGYTRIEGHRSAMPSFGPLHAGRTVLVDTGDGILTPTPEPMLELATYLQSIQQ